MKKIIRYASAIVFTMALTNLSFAQDAVLTSNPRSEMMVKDLNARNPSTLNQKIDWMSNEYGNNGMYTINNVNYMTRYDNEGNYIETYQKREWSDDATPEILKSSYSKSNYKDSNVTSYWEGSDSSKKGYYLEVTDARGKLSKVWVDDKGKFSSAPGRTKGMKKGDY